LKIDETKISELNQLSKISNNIEYNNKKSLPNQTQEGIKSTNSTNPNSSLIQRSHNNQIYRKSSIEFNSCRNIPSIDPSKKQEKGRESLEFSSAINLNKNQTPSEIETKNEKEILESKDLFFVRNYIIRTNLMSGIKSKDLKSLKTQFNQLHYAFDTSTIIDEYIFNSNKILFCLVCKRSFSSPFDVVQNLECKGEYFHPRFIMNSKSEKFVCNHELCKKKVIRGEFPCCHKNSQTAGCLLGDGKHHLVLIENNTVCSINNSF